MAIKTYIVSGISTAHRGYQIGGCRMVSLTAYDGAYGFCRNKTYFEDIGNGVSK
jgi:hypothetical protein